MLTVYVHHCHGGTTQKGFAIGCVNGSWPDFKPHAYVWLRVLLVATILHGQHSSIALPKPSKQAESEVTLAE